MVKHGYDYHAMASAFQKLAKLSGGSGKHSLTSSYPSSAQRSERAKKWAVAQDAKTKG